MRIGEKQILEKRNFILSKLDGEPISLVGETVIREWVDAAMNHACHGELYKAGQLIEWASEKFDQELEWIESDLKIHRA